MVLRLSVNIFLRSYSYCIILIDFIHFIAFSLKEIFVTIIQSIRSCNLRKSVSLEIALIIGSSHGIGRELSLQLSELGAVIVCVDDNSVENESTMKQIKERGGKAYGYTCDVKSRENVNKIVTRIKKEVGNITMLINFCGIPSASNDSKFPDIKTILDLNILSNFWLLNRVLPEMKRQRHGHIVLVKYVAGSYDDFNNNQMKSRVGQYSIQGLFESLLDDFFRVELQNNIKITLAHIYPFISFGNKLGEVPNSIFGTMTCEEAAKLILDGILNDKTEISVPKSFIYIESIMKFLPRRARLTIRTFLDSGVLDWNYKALN